MLYRDERAPAHEPHNSHTSGYNHIKGQLYTDCSVFGQPCTLYLQPGQGMGRSTEDVLGMAWSLRVSQLYPVYASVCDIREREGASVKPTCLLTLPLTSAQTDAPHGGQIAGNLLISTDQPERSLPDPILS